ncbi:AraC family transcriptional regulator [Leptolyngbya sp. FACHB-671]|nr:AraC family transcriptional regulator [Leptolyngbya sp. FACHB-671]MBD2068635.1 AraC family transcriptional regulator [Leptolyngbya sp. FACHB-671]
MNRLDKSCSDVAQFWDSSVPGIEFFSARLFRHSFTKHVHETSTVGINDGGQGCFSYQGEARCAYPGSFNLINPDEAHTGQASSSEGWIYRNLYITVPLIEQVLEQIEWQGQGLPYFVAPVVGDQSLQSTFRQLFDVLETPTSLLEQQSLLLEFFTQLFAKHAEPHYSPRLPKSETQAIAQVRTYLEAHYSQAITIERLATLVGLNPDYLIRSFHQQVGLPPHRYQQYCQLRQAKQSLRTATPLCEIATDRGFYDQSHLNHHFKRVFGVTPGQYRQSVLSKTVGLYEP